MQFVVDSEKRWAQQAAAQRLHVPPALSEQPLFTQAAPVTAPDAAEYVAPSQRIGALYSPQAAQAAALLARPSKLAGPAAKAARAGQLTSSGHGATAGCTTCHQASPPTSRGTAAAWGACGANRCAGGVSDVERAVLRYHHYVHSGIDRRNIAPYKDRVMTLAAGMRTGTRVTKEFRSALLAQAKDEVRGDYEAAVARSILHYLLLDPAERARMGLTALEPLLAQQAAAAARPSPPPVHRPAWPREALAWGLQTLSANALELSRLWVEGGFAQDLLVDVSSPELLDNLPVTVDWFVQHQTKHIEARRQQLWTRWLPRCVDVFRRLPPVPINDDTDAYYRSIATLQGNQLQDLMLRSLAAFTDLFSAQARVDHLDVHGDALLWSGPPLFEVSVEVGPGGDVSFAPSVDEAERSLLRLVEAVVAAVSGVPRLPLPAGQQVPLPPPAGEQKAISATDAVGNLPGSVLSLGLEHKHVTRQCCQVLANLLASARTVLGPLQSLLLEPALGVLGLDPDQHAADFAGRSASLEEYSDEVVRLRRVASSIEDACAGDVRTGMFLVRCRSAKQALAAMAEAPAAALLADVAKRTLERNLHIHKQFQAISMELSRPCSTVDELAACKRCIGQSGLEMEQLREWLAENKAREEFLFKHRHMQGEGGLEAARRAHVWLKRMPELIKDASIKATAEQRALARQSALSASDAAAAASQGEGAQGE